ncbi:MAG: CAP domain-containing protein [Blastocatellia bacterium]|nr:CAP domain-containing protein [Blastocatellia bacterium]
MRNSKRNALILAVITFVFAASSAAAQNVCTKQVDDTAVKLYIRNATAKAFTVHYVDDKCKESLSDEKIEPGRAFSGDTHNGHAFRVREDGTNKLLQAVVANPDHSTVTIGNIKNADPRQGFLETLNRVRKGRNLPPMEFDNSLNQACQWFADLMAKYDKGGHDAVEVGGNSYANMKEPEMRTKKFGYKGDGGTEATASGDYADVSLIGGDAMLGWSSSDTHFRPFLSLDDQVFKQVGFGYARSATNKDTYYTCAVFGNPDTNAGGDAQPNNEATNKEPIKTEVPAGLKFTELKFQDEAEKTGASFLKTRLQELMAQFSFENPSGQPFNIEARAYLNGKVISSEPFEDLKGSGAMEWRIAGEKGQAGTVQSGTYRAEILLNGKAVLSAQAVVK